MPSIRIDGKARAEFEEAKITGSLQFGDDWRIKKSGDALAQERKEDGTWNEKSSAQP